MTSGNPVQRQRREGKRREEASEAIALMDPHTPEDHRRIEELRAHNEAVLQQQRQFLPYGANPKAYFETTEMAAWGEYQTSLQSGTAEGYSAETCKLLADDMHSTIPYRYTSYVPLTSAESLQWPLHGTAGLVFDIDGVISRSGRLLCGADTAIQTLQTLRIPFVFMTNGGSCSEAEKASELSSLLGTTVAPSQVILAHSPMRLQAPRFRDEPVLIVGHSGCLPIARSYGFANAISIQQYQAEHPEMLPYKKWGELRTAAPGSIPFPSISAIFQFDDPTDPFNDIQTILDVLTSPFGRVGNSISGTQSIPYFVSADDLLWSTAAPLPRLGQGAFREMMSSVYESVTGQGLQITLYGKPRAVAFAYARKKLLSQSVALGWDAAKMRAIFMVGDNIESDILGANAAQGLWTSVHVLTGLGRTPAARRTLSVGDEEHEWLERWASRRPHYVAPSADHFVRELLAFPEQAMLQNKTPYYGKPNPVDLKDVYNLVE